MPVETETAPTAAGAKAETAAAGTLAICLDADLLGGDLAREGFWHGLKSDWRTLRHAPAVLFGATRAASAVLNGGPGPDVETLPYRRAALDRIDNARAEGRRVVLTAPASLPDGQ